MISTPQKPYLRKCQIISNIKIKNYIFNLFSKAQKPKKKYIYLIRYGETNFNTDQVRRDRRRIDVPLNDIG